MLKKLFSLLHYFIFLVAGLILVWWQLKSMSPLEKEEFYKAFDQVNYWVILPVIIMSILSHISRSMRWKLLLEPLNYHPSLKNVFAVTMVGYLANSAVPRLGEILKCTLLARYEKLKVDKLVGSILVERTFDFICYLVFIAITVLIQVNLVSGYLKKELRLLAGNNTFPLWAKMLIIVGIIVSLVFTIKWLVKKYPHNKIIEKAHNFFAGIGTGFSAIRKLKQRSAFMAHTLFIWAMYLLQIYIGFQAMGATSHLGFGAAFSVLSLATLAMIATPGGIGSFPIFVAQTLLIYSISFPLGKAFGWLMWGVSTGIIVTCGVAALIVLPYINKNKRTHEPQPLTADELPLS